MAYIDDNEIVAPVDICDTDETYIILVKFTKRKTEGGYSYLAEFPDLETCIAKGSNMNDTWERAEDIISHWLLDARYEDRERLRSDSMDRLFNYQDSDDNIKYSFIHVNLAEYRRKLSQKAIKKSVTIPEWLNDYAEKKNVNFSQMLQNALMDFISKDGKKER